jgi:hypothetical protein
VRAVHGALPLVGSDEQQPERGQPYLCDRGQTTGLQDINGRFTGATIGQVADPPAFNLPLIIPSLIVVSSHP